MNSGCVHTSLPRSTDDSLNIRRLPISRFACLSPVAVIGAASNTDFTRQFPVRGSLVAPCDTTFTSSNSIAQSKLANFIAGNLHFYRFASLGKVRFLHVDD